MVKPVLAAAISASLVLAPVSALAGERASASHVSLAMAGGAQPDLCDLDDGLDLDEDDEVCGLSPALAAALALFLGVSIHEILTSRGIFD